MENFQQTQGHQKKPIHQKSDIQKLFDLNQLQLQMCKDELQAKSLQESQNLIQSLLLKEKASSQKSGAAEVLPKIKRSGSDPKFDNVEYLQKCEEQTMANMLKMMEAEAPEESK